MGILFIKEKLLVYLQNLEAPKGTLSTSQEKEKPEQKTKEILERKGLERQAAQASLSEARAELRTESGMNVLDEAKKKEALIYTREYTREQVQNMLKISEKMSVYKLWRGGSLRRKSEREKNPDKKSALLKDLRENQGYAEMTAQFAMIKYDANKRLYLEVNLYNKSKFEDYIGAGHICPPEWLKVAIVDTKGRTKIGFRKIPGQGGINGEKIGYFTADGEYLCVYSGYKIYPLDVKTDEKHENDEEIYYENNRKRFKEVSESRISAVPSKPEIVRTNEDNEKLENSRFVRALTLFTTASGEKFYHTVARAKEDPPAGVPREMGGRWNEERIMQWGAELEKRYGIPAVLILTIARFESGRGVNRLSYELGNYFGIKPWGSLKRSMRRIAGTKYPDHREYGDFSNRGKQDHEHFADAWSSFVRYAELMSKTGRYGRGVEAFRGNAMMIVATQALSGYCPSRNYIKTAGQVMRSYAKKYNIEIGRIDYPQLMEFMRRHNPERLSVEEINLRLLPAKKAGFVDGMPD
ncbi:glucosaminidase domain-containing protein [Candidatus Peregrinibacteria bacterium]|nr:glucosaminidase domain-containing protein [Candidatus Peregrinibacteria bacterium]